MKAFVTGATGFVGGALVRHLVAEGVEIRALVRPESDPGALSSLPVEVARGDLTDRASVHAAMVGCDTVFHVAALYSTREADATAMYEVNVSGTKNVLRVAADLGIGRVVHTSTIGTIGRGDPDSLPDETVEFDQWDTASHYARSKYLAELLAFDLAREGLPVVVVNPTSPIGAGDARPSSSGKRVLDALAGRLGAFPPGGINFVSVRDVAAGHLLAARNGRMGRRYILGNLEGNLKHDEFLSLVRTAAGLPATVKPVFSPLSALRRALAPPKPRGALPHALTCDCSLAVRELGLPQTPLAQAFAESVAWFREHGYVGQVPEAGPAAGGAQ